eukprot:SAG22_NODE_1557_length_4130_cov_12.560159_1_plen_147_part_00
MLALVLPALTVQWFTVAAVDDDVVTGDRTAQVRHDWVSADSHYNGLVDVGWYTLEVAVEDDDTAGVTVSDTELSLTEGSAAAGGGGAVQSYNVTLMSEPVGDVFVNIAGSSSAVAVRCPDGAGGGGGGPPRAKLGPPPPPHLTLVW